jgi:hypothetical protein
VIAASQLHNLCNCCTTPPSLFRPAKALRTKRVIHNPHVQTSKDIIFGRILPYFLISSEIQQMSKRILTRVGFEPTPFRTSELDVVTTLSWRLRPLGHLALLMWRNASRMNIIFELGEVVGVGLRLGFVRLRLSLSQLHTFDYNTNDERNCRW